MRRANTWPGGCPFASLQTPPNLEGDDDGLEVVAPPLNVSTNFLHVDVVQRGVDLVHHEERSRPETECEGPEVRW